jgi:PIN domain nuclease of toxin-antitoxin system
MARERTMILDTCALIWLASGDTRLSDSAREQIARSPDVAVSAITAFEIGVKYAKGKLSLPCRPAAWFETALRLHGLSICNIDHHVALRACELPLIHADPCDRLIVATSQLLDRPIVTTDSRIAQYEVDTIN